MALLPGEEFLINQIDGQVVLYAVMTDDEVVRFDPSDANATAKAQKVIHDSTLLSDEQKCFAHFWSGYFYAHATGSNEG